ncbi:hypothetical protein [Liquorilactobacillus satsumensis]|uniref:hypothetical protein n=1 Tax=Liquorilactobacillus satsumensis TaxID=259059 RepID=UPI0039E84A55
MDKNSGMKVLKKATSLKKRYYFSPVSLIMLLLLLLPCFQVLVPETIALFQAGASVFVYPWVLIEFSKTLLLSMVVMAVTVFNIIFYPWINEWTRQIPVIRGLFKGQRGFKGFWTNTYEEMRLKYAITPRDTTEFKDKYGYTYKVEKSSGTKRAETAFVVVKKLVVLYLRFIVLCIVWLFGCVLGWFICK